MNISEESEYIYIENNCFICFGDNCRLKYVKGSDICLVNTIIQVQDKSRNKVYVIYTNMSYLRHLLSHIAIYYISKKANHLSYYQMSKHVFGGSLMVFV